MDYAGILIDALRAAVGPVAAAYALSATGLNLQFGYTGLLNFGHVGFMLAGAYGAAITVEAGGSLWLGIPIGIAAAVLLGLLLGFPTLRLRADYLAIVTISAAEILRLVVRSSWANPVTKSVFGIRAFANEFFDLNPFDVGKDYGWGDFVFSGRQLWVVVVSWTVVAVAGILVYRMIHSPWGRVIRAIREDEDAARSLGKHVFSYKLQSLMIGGGLAGLAGILLAIEQQSVFPDTWMPKITFFLYVIVILGGAGTVIGPIVGAIVFQFLYFFFDRFMTNAQLQGWFGNVLDATAAAQVKLVLVGAGLMTLMALRPEGIFGHREELLIDER
ncbi:MAG: branched-chain amino acid ABC transporter permease [Acidimicrobiia bacterium]|jgi:branched-chain amino acid transport system permease protein